MDEDSMSMTAITHSQQYKWPNQNQNQNNKPLRQYLRKKNSQLLPCQQFKKQQKPPSKPQQATKSKAQIYSDLRKNNQEKFGEWKSWPQKLVESQQQEQKKIDPKKMTVDYHHKPTIQTAEYKKPGIIDEKQKAATSTNSQKAKYQKLLQDFCKDRQELQQEKEQFKAECKTLQFKRKLAKEAEIPFMSAVKNQIEYVRSSRLPKQTRDKDKETGRKQKKVSIPERSMEELSRNIEHTSNHMKAMKQTISQLEQQQQLPEQSSSKPFTILELRSFTSLNAQEISETVNLQSLLYDQNQKYRQAQRIFQQNLNLNLSQTNHAGSAIENVEEEAPHSHIQKDPAFKIKWVKEKRVKKYDNGWVQVWTPKKQRLMTDGQGYKVVWLCNGDVKQIFNDRLQSYYSKSCKVVQISCNNGQPVYFYPQLWQLEQYTSPKRDKKTIVYRDGTSFVKKVDGKKNA